MDNEPDRSADSENLRQHIESLAEENRSLRKQLEDLEKSQTTEANQTLQLAEYIIDHSPAILFRRRASDDLDDRKMVYVSPNISRFGYKAEDLLSSTMMFRDMVYAEDLKRVSKEIDQHVEQQNKQYSQYYRIVTSEGELRWVEDRTSVVEDQQGNRFHQGIVIDIHERKEAEEKLRKSEEKYRQIVETTCEGFVLLDHSLMIIDLNTAFAKMIGTERAQVIGTDPSDLLTGLDTILQDQEPDGPVAYEFHEFESRLATADGAAIPVLIHANTLRSDNGELMGIMAFITDISEHKKALMLAGEVQKSLLPDKAPQVKDFDIAGRNIACEEVGGDYFDYLNNGNAEAITVVVGDISGHGVDSALLMSSGRAFLRMRALQPGTGAEIVSALNRHLCEDVAESGRFMTLFYLHVDADRQQIQWIRAGHDPGLRYDPEGERFEELKGPGLALGVDETYRYVDQYSSDLRAGQIFLIYTDGLWEAYNRNNEAYGKERLKRCIRANAHLGAEEILEKILADQRRFRNGLKNEDDITLVVVKYLPRR